MLQYGNVDRTGKYHKLLTEEWKYGCNDPPPPHNLEFSVQKTLTKGEGTSPNNAYSFTKI